MTFFHASESLPRQKTTLPYFGLANQASFCAVLVDTWKNLSCEKSYVVLYEHRAQAETGSKLAQLLDMIVRLQMNFKFHAALLSSATYPGAYWPRKLCTFNHMSALETTRFFCVHHFEIQTQKPIGLTVHPFFIYFAQNLYLSRIPRSDGKFCANRHTQWSPF